MGRHGEGETWPWFGRHFFIESFYLKNVNCVSTTFGWFDRNLKETNMKEKNSVREWKASVG